MKSIFKKLKKPIVVGICALIMTSALALSVLAISMVYVATSSGKITITPTKTGSAVNGYYASSGYTVKWSGVTIGGTQTGHIYTANEVNATGGGTYRYYMNGAGTDNYKKYGKLQGNITKKASDIGGTISYSFKVADEASIPNYIAFVRMPPGEGWTYFESDLSLWNNQSSVEYYKKIKGTAITYPADVDITAPTLSLSLTRIGTAYTDNKGQTWSREARVTATATDTESRPHTATPFRWNNGSLQAWGKTGNAVYSSNNTVVTDYYTFSNNVTVSVQSMDGVSNVSNASSITVDGIDRTAPIVTLTCTVNNPVLVNGKEWTKDTVTVKATASDSQSGLHEKAYSWNGGGWTSENTYIAQKNEKVTVKVRDNVGNESPANEKEIDCIDKTAPEVTLTSTVNNPVPVNGKEWTKDTVTVTATASDSQTGLHEKAYSWNGGGWTSENTYTAQKNEKVTVKVRDSVGNESPANEKEIDCIDKTAPIVTLTCTVNNPVLVNGKEWTKDSVTVKATASDSQSGLHEKAYSWNGGGWTSENTYIAQANETVTVIVRDNVGNNSPLHREEIDGIDKTAPIVKLTSTINNPILVNEREWTKDTVTVKATASDSQSDLHEKAYSWNGGDWTSENIYIAQTNETVTVIVRDNVGNESPTYKEEIDCIDKTAPEVTLTSTVNNPVLVNGKEWTKDSVTVKATASDSQSGLHEKAYSWNGGGWTSENTYIAQTNETVTVEVRDHVGNTIPLSENIDCIDKTPPEISVKIVLDNPITTEGKDWTRDFVTLEVEAVDNQSGIPDEPYSWDDGVTWTSENTYIAQANETVTVIVRDNVGNQASISKDIECIDKTAPKATISLKLDGARIVDGKIWTKDSVTLVVKATDSQSGLHETAYSWDNGNTWTSDNTYIAEANRTIDLIVRDKVGNQIHLSQEIDYLDKTLPQALMSIEVISPQDVNGKDWTRDSVTLTVVAEDNQSGLHTKAYSWNNGEWTSQNTYTAHENGMVSVNVRDYVGNTVTIKQQVDCIDKVAPEVALSMGINGAHIINGKIWAREFVTLEVTAIDNLSGLPEEAYSWDDGITWTSDNTYVAEENGTINLHVRDNVGNTVKLIQSIDNIDKTLPELSIVISANNRTIDQYEQINLMEGVSAIDIEEGNITNKIQISVFAPDTSLRCEIGEGSNADYTFKEEGVWQAVFSVTDSAGKVVSKTVNIVVRPAAQVTYKINDDDKDITYHGDWMIYSNDPSLYQGNQHYTNEVDAYVEYSFKGTEISWIGATNNNLGKVDVYIDEVLEVEGLDLYSSDVEWQKVLFKKTGLSYDIHTIKIVVTGQKNINATDCNLTIDAFEYVSYAKPENKSKINDDNSDISYSGKWLYHMDNSNLYEGDQHYSNEENAYVEYSFEGTEISWIGATNYNLGKADVYIDEVLEVEGMDLYSPDVEWQKLLFNKSGLSYGLHTLKIVVTGQKNENASDCYVTIDCFEWR